MTPPEPGAVDALITALLVQDDPILDDAASAAAGMPAISVSAPQGKLLHLLARAIGARRVLELGTLAGYSTIWLARAVPPDGRVTTIELEPRYADVAAANLARAGVADRVDLRVGPALDVLPGVEGPFDLAFLDADKATMPQQLELVLPRMRTGGVVVCDNVIRRGAVADDDAARTEPSIRGVRGALELLGADPRVDATAIQTVGDKSHDGFALAVVR